MLFYFSQRESYSLLMENNEWNDFSQYMTSYKLDTYDLLEIFKFGQELIVFKKEEKIFKIR